MQAEHVVIMLKTFYTFRPKKTKVRAVELAAKLNVSERSVYRYMDELNCSGIPLIHKRGCKGGFTLLDGGAE